MEEEHGLSGDAKRRFKADLETAVRTVRSAADALVVTHIDADGITAGAIASLTLERLGIPHTVTFEKQIDDEAVGRVNGSAADLVWMSDLGSGYLSRFKRPGIVITDHHVPEAGFRTDQTRIDQFSDIVHLNPHLYGIDGTSDVSGAGMAYLLAREIDPANRDLAYLGVIGAVGDFQDSRGGGLTGCNRAILADAVAAGDVAVEEDIRLFGRETRPLVQLLQYCGDPSMPGLSNDREGCVRFFGELDIPLKDGREWRVWNDLEVDERRRAAAAIIRHADESGSGPPVFGEVYTVTAHERGTGLRDAKEFSTILNSCGRYDDAVTGLRICKGDLTALEDAERNRENHRRNISAALAHVRDNSLVRERRFIQYFDSGPEIRETIVGIVAGMLVNSGQVRRGLPLIAFAESDNGLKVSARSTYALADRGLDLSAVMSKAAELVGGQGGGHRVAAGATIPADRREDFLGIVEDLVSIQLI